MIYSCFRKDSFSKILNDVYGKNLKKQNATIKSCACHSK